MPRVAVFGLSFEIFHPQTLEGDASLWDNVGRLAQLRPACIACTSGAGGPRAPARARCTAKFNALKCGSDDPFHRSGGDAWRIARVAGWLAPARFAGITNFMARNGGDPS